jgi:hypothetical protein
MKKENRGGVRKGAGPKFIYGEDTVNITLRVPVSKKAQVKEMIYSYLNQFKVSRSDVTHKEERYVIDISLLKGEHYGC